MSFRFNFLCSDIDESKDLGFITKISGNCITEKKCENLLSGPCDLLSLSVTDLQNPDENISLINICDYEIKYVLVNSIQMKTNDEAFSQIDALETDIIPGKYEGGLKIWECSIDLAIFLAQNKCIKSEDSVLELGCGAGLPGIVAYLKGAKVTFQDFNSEVLKFVTVPNTVLNTPEDKVNNIPDICQYIYGDWESINSKFYTTSESVNKYDVILTSETIYEKSNQGKLLELMKSTLKPEGTIYVAAKIHYFGVGGGVADFETLVKEDQTFEISLVKRIENGVERQILMMKFKTQMKQC